MIYDDYKYRIPQGKRVRLIIDTDAKNEADDQYCIVHALLSPKFDNRGIIAAHFGNEKTPHSMQDSYDEVVRVLDKMDFPKELLYKGAEHEIPDMKTPVASEGADLIIEEAMKESDEPLYVIFLGPLTDMASALLKEPRIADRMTCIWIGGEAYPEGGFEYNLSNDVKAARYVFNSTIPLWQIPRNVYTHVTVSMAELEYKVYPCGEIGKYLFEQLEEWGQTKWAIRGPRTGEYWSLGDSPAIGVLLYAHMYDYEWQIAPYITDEMNYMPSKHNRPIRVYNKVDYRFILEDMFAKLALFAKKKGQMNCSNN